MVQVNQGQALAGVCAEALVQVGHGLIHRGVGLGAAVKVHRALNAQQPLFAQIGAQLQVGVVQQLFVGLLVLAHGNIKVSVVDHIMVDGPHPGQIPLHGGQIQGGPALQQLL